LKDNYFFVFGTFNLFDFFVKSQDLIDIS